MARVNNIHQAEHIAADYLKHRSLVVSETGDIFANCDVDKICDVLENEKLNFFILKGDRFQKVKK